ncbi:NAD(P)-binding protein [Fluviispira multicolorata]|uniref:FAD-dependent oxidoreductase n=1 Tax=Fluviispira multicolorata TaxID=2654512 RepID=A0A833JF68_9BACT|nr:FAD/NAD(P)-binding protein [Fluviispira multicolorata]KAB8033273.1 FAD-dependent oxidoreductase [Fluviispira multicolorata]
MTISRRDFLNGLSISIAAGLAPIDALNALPLLKSDYYPPALTGLRGNHVGSFENAHKLGRDKLQFPIKNRSIEEKYDAVIVGGGISGLSSAYFYQKKYGKNAKILVLDNHDDFGGHAKRNEFHIDGKLILGYGGTESLQSPKSNYSKIAIQLLKELSVDIDNLGNKFHRNFYPDLGMSRAVFFNKESFDVDKMVTGDPTRAVADDIDPKRLNGRKIKDFINDFPLSKDDKIALIKLYEDNKNYLPEKSIEERLAYLKKISYHDFLIKYAGLSKQAAIYFQARSNDFFAIGSDGISALEARTLALPGFEGMELPPLEGEDHNDLNDPYIYHFPDGNASIARLLVRKMIPQVASGNNIDDLILTKFDYSKLDLKNSPVRIRLNSTAVHVKNNSDNSIDVGYLDKSGKLHCIQTKHCVMACYNMMIPHIIPDLPNEQKLALSKNVKAALVYSKVILRNWQSFNKLKVHEIYVPDMKYSRVKIDYAVDFNKYSHAKNPNEPICLHMVYVPTTPNAGLDARTQARLARAKLLTTPFAEMENDIRQQLQRMLGSEGFDHKKDILAITVNRWSHGYSYTTKDLFDDEDDMEKTIRISSKPFNNITIANSDSSWNPYTHTAIDMAHRAVNEFI